MTASPEYAVSDVFARWRQSLLRKAEIFPALYQFGDLRRFPTLTSTTDFFVRNYTEIDSLDEYLDGYAITGNRLADLQVSTLAIFSDDDPVIPIADIDRVAESAALEIEIQKFGGHCGFADSLAQSTWIDRRIASELARLA